MNESNSKGQSYNSPQRRSVIATEYVVPNDDFDRTPTTLLSLDNYLLDKDVSSLVKTLFTDVRNWNTWAVDYLQDSPCYFSPPFNNRLYASLLGYDNTNNAL